MHFKFKYIALNTILFILILGIVASFFNLGVVSLVFSVVLPVLFILNVLLSFYGLITTKYMFLTGTISFLFFFGFIYKFTGKIPKNEANTIRLLSFNVREFNTDHDINQKDISHRIIKFIDSIHPEILMLQESNVIESKGIKGYPYYFSGVRNQVNKTLLPIYSKYPIIDSGYITFPNTLNNCTYSDILIKKDTIRLYNAHLQSFGIELNSDKKNNNRFHHLFNKLNSSFNKQVEQAKLIKEHTENRGKRILIGGDFNTTAYGLPYRILKRGMVDSYISKGHGLGSTYYLFNYPLRLDYIMVNKYIEIQKHQNFYLNLSDHEPILVNFKLL